MTPARTKKGQLPLKEPAGRKAGPPPLKDRASRGASRAPTEASLGFGNELRKARSSQGLTLSKLSEDSGVSIAYLSDLERGVLGNPTLDTLRAIAKALNVSLNDLLGVDDATERRPRYPAALEEFRALTPFREVIAEDAKRRSRNPDELEEEWVQTLADLQIGGRRPKSPSDYFFIFEAIRRAVDRR
jgi:transcriptional regulator with XRE-family HTH domain